VPLCSRISAASEKKKKKKKRRALKGFAEEARGHPGALFSANIPRQPGRKKRRGTARRTDSGRGGEDERDGGMTLLHVLFGWNLREKEEKRGRGGARRQNKMRPLL